MRTERERTEVVAVHEVRGRLAAGVVLEVVAVDRVARGVHGAGHEVLHVEALATGHAPFAGGGPMNQNILGGQIDMGIGSVALGPGS